MTTPANPIRDWLEGHARRATEKTFIRSLDQEAAVTYGEAWDVSQRVSACLAARGIGANDRVALLSGNSLEHLLVYLGIMAHGATICTVHVEMNVAHLGNILAALGAKLTLAEDGVDAADAEPLGTWQNDGATGFFAEIADAGPADAAPITNTGDDIASIFYTSGTEAAPKGIPCSFADLSRNSAAAADGFGMTADDRILDYRSFNWMSAQTLSALGTLSKGATLLLARQFSRSRFFDWIADEGATIAAGNPTVLNMLVNEPADVTAKDVPQLRFVTSSSAPLLVKDWQAFEALYGIPVVQGYGSSESGWIAASRETERRMGSSGRPLAYHKLAIVGADGALLPPGETGAIELGHGPDALFRHVGEDGGMAIDATGRLKTGDLGYLDEDGFLFVTGREKDLIIRGGVNIAPVEIDNVLMGLDGVAEAAVAGVPDDMYGQAVAAFVVAKPNARLAAADVIAFCEARLPAAKVPKTVAFLDALPKTARGKLDRKALAAGS